MKVRLSIILALVLSIICAKAQDKSDAAEYRKVVTQRADKIVQSLGIADSSKYKQVREIIADQYIALNNIHDTRNAEVKKVKENLKDNKEQASAEVKKLEAAADESLSKLHKQYLQNLSEQLSKKQIEQVKNGMTYNVLPKTYKAYQEMLPNLKKKEKKQILAWLTEAREHAMDAESSEKKHAWFGKYKGRINNYLSGHGIDMNKAGKEWQERIRAANAQSKSVN